MGLTLTIENETNLPDGGPLSVRVTGKRGLDIGRDAHLDWTLPDPTRYISSKHCEIRYRDGGYWLYDVSSNGTFLNGSDGRLKAPHQLRHGDRLTIGQYIIAVALDGEEAGQREPVRQQQSTSYQELWSSAEDAAPPVDRNLLRPAASHAPVRPDFLDWAVDVPGTGEPGFVPAPTRQAPARPEDMDWASGPARQAPPPEPGPAMPAPRRPVWVSSEPSGPWGGSAAPAGTVESAPGSLSPEPPPPGPRQPSPAVPHAPPAGVSAAPADFVRLVAQGAGLPEQVFAQDPARLAEQLGVLVRLVAENTRQLLNARLQAKRLARMSAQTTIEALNNNPLKFSPTTEDALRIMFGPPTTSYLDSRKALEEAFNDIKEHQVRTYSAMQQALVMMIEDLDPQAIEESAGTGGLSSVIGSRKSRMWDTYSERWKAKTRGQEEGILGVFMQYFAECYDRGAPRNRQ
jgi:type VI secretion system protein ImpI